MAQKQENVQQRDDSKPVDRRDFLKASGAGMAAVGMPGYVSFQGNVTLDIWLSYYTEGETKKQYTDNIVQEFQDETGIGVNIRGVPYTDIVTQFRSARAAGDVPHMVEVMTRPGVLTGGAGLQVNDLFETSELADKVSDKVMEGHRVWGAQSTGEEGALVSIPLGLRPFFTCWRMDWLEQAGIDRTEVNHEAGSLHWEDDMPEIYQQLQQTDLGQQQGNFPDTTGMKQSDEEYLSLYIPMYGGSRSGVVNVDGTEATINSEAAKNAIKMQFRYIQEGYFHENSINHGDEESTTLQWSGTIACNHIQDSTDLWSDYWEEQPDAMENGRYTWGLPMNAGTKAALSWLPSLGFIEEGFNNQQEQDAAMRFIDWWIADNQRAVENSQNLGFVPPTPEAIREQDFYSQTDIHEEFWQGACLKTLEEFETATIPAIPGASTITYDIPRQMHQRAAQAIQQGTSIDEAVNQATEQAAEAINEQLERGQG